MSTIQKDTRIDLRIQNSQKDFLVYAASLRNQKLSAFVIDSALKEAEELANHPIPVIILARLAVDKDEQGSGIGKGLLKNALLRIVHAADIIGGRAVLVHAKDKQAKLFYEHFGFEPSPIDDFHLYLLL